jgi:hypothetical protein
MFLDPASEVSRIGVARVAPKIGWVKAGLENGTGSKARLEWHW